LFSIFWRGVFLRCLYWHTLWPCRFLSHGLTGLLPRVRRKDSLDLVSLSGNTPFAPFLPPSTLIQLFSSSDLSSPVTSAAVFGLAFLLAYGPSASPMLDKSKFCPSPPGTVFPRLGGPRSLAFFQTCGLLARPGPLFFPVLGVTPHFFPVPRTGLEMIRLPRIL